MSGKMKHKTRSRKTYKSRLAAARFFCGGYTMSVKERWLLGMFGQYGRRK